MGRVLMLLRGLPLLLLLTLTSADSCADIQAAVNEDSAVKPSQMSACLNSFNYSASIASSTLDTLQKTLGAYVFLGSTNLAASLKTIGLKTYVTERAFHDAVRAVLVATGDSHLYYESCFHLVSSSLALPLTGVVYDDGTEGVAVVTTLEATNALWPGVNVTRYARARVAKINGKDALTVLRSFASNPVDYVARDWAVRFNLGLAHPTFYYPGSNSAPVVFDYPGAYAQRSGSIPAADFVTLTLKRQGSNTWENVNVPWAVTYTGFGFGTTADEYYASNCALAVGDSGLNPEGRQALGDSQPSPGNTRRRLDAIRRGTNVQADGRRRLTSTSTVLTSNVCQAYLLADGVTGVIVVPSFDPLPTAIVNAVKESIPALLAVNATRLIIDVRGNNGGRVLSGFQFVNQLFPTLANPSPRFVFPGSRYAQRLVLSSLQTFSSDYCLTILGCRYFPTTWLDDSLNPISKFYDFFFPVTTTLVPSPKGSTAPFTNIPVSQIFRQKFTAQSKLWESAPFSASNVIVLSDGSCQSTCAMVVHILRWRIGVKVAFVGGVPGSNPSISGSVQNAAGGVISLTELLDQEVTNLGELGQDNQPAAFPVQATFKFPIRAALQQRSTAEPSKAIIDAFEFLPLPPSYRIYNSWAVVDNAEAAWPKAAAFFT